MRALGASSNGCVPLHPTAPPTSSMLAQEALSRASCRFPALHEGPCSVACLSRWGVEAVALGARHSPIQSRELEEGWCSAEPPEGLPLPCELCGSGEEAPGAGKENMGPGSRVGLGPSAGKTSAPGPSRSSDSDDERSSARSTDSDSKALAHPPPRDESVAEIVHVSEGVAVYPSPQHPIEGRLLLLRQHGLLFVAWLPSRTPAGEEGEAGDAGSPITSSPQTSLANPAALAGSRLSAPDPASFSNPQQYSPPLHGLHAARCRSLYSLHPLPLRCVHALCRTSRGPLGPQALTFVLQGGVSLPPFAFLRGGQCAFLSALREQCRLERSRADPSVLLVDGREDPMSRSLRRMGLLEGGGGAGGGAGVDAPAPSVSPAPRSPQEEPTPSFFGAAHPVLAQTEQAFKLDFSQLLDRFHQLARSTKDQACSIALAVLGDDPPEEEQAGEALSLRTASLDSATLVVSAAEEVCGAARALSLVSSREADGGFQLLERLEGDALEAAAAAEGHRERGGQPREAGPVAGLPEKDARRPPPPPLTLSDLACHRDARGALMASAALGREAYERGLAPSARLAAWETLLGVGTGGCRGPSTEQARCARYAALRAQWAGMGADQVARWRAWRERSALVDKDVRRTDRAHPFFAKEGGGAARALRRLLLTHCLYDVDLGYCQGMSDLAAPMLWVARCGIKAEVGGGEAGGERRKGGGTFSRPCQGEPSILTRPSLGESGEPEKGATCLGSFPAAAEPPPPRSLRVESAAFWLFAAAVDRVRGNFAKDGARMGCQLRVLRVVLRASDPELEGHLAAAGAGDMLCAYRWLLVLFKRELAFDQALRLWDALWTGRPCAHLPVLLAAGLLRRRRGDILRGCRDADAVLQACLAWAGELDVQEMLRDAADVYRGLGERTQGMLREVAP